MPDRSRIFIALLAILTLFLFWQLLQNLEIIPIPQAAATLDSMPVHHVQFVGPNFTPLKKSNHIKALAANAPPSAEPPREEQISHEVAFCKILNSRTQVPIRGNLKLSTYSYEVDEEGESGFTAYIQSSECPKGLFSKVRLNSLGEIKEEINCMTETPEEIFTRSGVQGNVEYRPSTKNKLNLAISGEGFFALECKEGIFLSRSGDFRWDGMRATYGNCFVLSKDGTYFNWDGGNIDDEGCAANGSCVALLGAEANSVSYVDRITFRANADPFHHHARDGRIFFDSLENLEDSEVGPMGPAWESISEFKVPLNCK